MSLATGRVREGFRDEIHEAAADEGPPQSSQLAVCGAVGRVNKYSLGRRLVEKGHAGRNFGCIGVDGLRYYPLMTPIGRS